MSLKSGLRSLRFAAQKLLALEALMSDWRPRMAPSGAFWAGLLIGFAVAGLVFAVT